MAMPGCRAVRCVGTRNYTAVTEVLKRAPDLDAQDNDVRGSNEKTVAVELKDMLLRKSLPGSLEERYP
jgi:hypothetical protein